MEHLKLFEEYKKIFFLPIGVLWEVNKNTGWYIDGILLSLNDVYNEDLEDIDLNNEEINYHIQTINYFIEKFKNGIGETDAIEIDNKNIVLDGNHRLVAAKFLDKEIIPVYL